MESAEVTVNLSLAWWVWLIIAGLILLGVWAKWIAAHYEMKRNEKFHRETIGKINEEYETLEDLSKYSEPRI